MSVEVAVNPLGKKTKQNSSLFLQEGKMQLFTSPFSSAGFAVPGTERGVGGFPGHRIFLLGGRGPGETIRLPGNRDRLAVSINASRGLALPPSRVDSHVPERLNVAASR